MAKVSLSETFGASLEWTKTLFLRPFSFKKWALFFLIAMFAFQMQGGMNLRLGNAYNGPAKETEGAATASSGQPSSPFMGQRAPAAAPTGDRDMRSYMPLFIGLGIVALVALLLVWWLRSVFLFIFIGSIANNDASIREPFRKDRSLGTSYFAWTLLLTLIFLAAFLVPLKSGYDILVRSGVVGGTAAASFGSVALALLPHIIAAVALFIIAGLIGFFMEDYVAIVMSKTRLSFSRAVPEALGLVTRSPATTIKYMLFKIALAIAVAIGTTVISFLMLITFAVPALIIGIGLGLLYAVIPAPVRTAFFIILALAGVPVIIAAVFVANMVFTPLSYFYKAFNMKFIARLDGKYDLFRAA